MAKMLMSAGITYTQFDELAKRAFIEQALGDPDPRGRTTNTSRVAVRTGLSRKEVARVRQAIADGGAATGTFQIGRPARALQIWHAEQEFLDESQIPLDLAFDGEEPSFTTLVRRVGGDVPAGAVRAELLAAGGMVELPNGRFRVKKRFFIPAAFNEDLVVGFAFIVAPMLETLRHNLENPAEAFIHRVSYSDHLPESERAAFRLLSHRQAEQLMHSVDEWIAAHEEAPSVTEDVERRVGLGVFYFEAGSPK
jgi:hypothetical protein